MVAMFEKVDKAPLMAWHIALVKITSPIQNCNNVTNVQ
jgi:hypothetical protein